MRKVQATYLGVKLFCNKPIFRPCRPPEPGYTPRTQVQRLEGLRADAALEAQAVPDQRIWEAADINKATWKAYEDLLARTHLVAPVPAFSSNRLKRLTTYPKRFLADTAMALALAGIDRAHRSANQRSPGSTWSRSRYNSSGRRSTSSRGRRLTFARVPANARSMQ